MNRWTTFKGTLDHEVSDGDGAVANGRNGVWMQREGQDREVRERERRERKGERWFDNMEECWGRERSKAKECVCMYMRMCVVVTAACG